MQAVFGTVLFVVVALSALVALLTFAGSRRAYGEIGKGLLALRDGSDRPASEPRTGGAGAAAARAAELRQLLEARNAVRERSGKTLLDVDAELASLLAPQATTIDPALEAEIRELVIARSARRVRRGGEPLDIDAEVARQVAELG